MWFTKKEIKTVSAYGIAKFARSITRRRRSVQTFLRSVVFRSFHGFSCFTMSLQLQEMLILRKYAVVTVELPRTGWHPRNERLLAHAVWANDTLIISVSYRYGVHVHGGSYLLSEQLDRTRPRSLDFLLWFRNFWFFCWFRSYDFYQQSSIRNWRWKTCQIVSKWTSI